MWVFFQANMISDSFLFAWTQHIAPLVTGDFLDSSAGKESACNAGDLGLIPGLGRSPGGGHGTQSSILAWRIPMDRGAWRATVHGVAKCQTQLSD